MPRGPPRCGWTGAPWSWPCRPRSGRRRSVFGNTSSSRSSQHARRAAASPRSGPSRRRTTSVSLNSPAVRQASFVTKTGSTSELRPGAPDVILVSEPTLGATLRTKGRFYFLCEVSRQHGTNAGADVAKEVADLARQEYYYDLSAGIEVSLRKALRQANRRAAQRLRDHRGRVTLHCACAVVVNNELYAARIGAAPVFLVRRARPCRSAERGGDRGQHPLARRCALAQTPTDRRGDRRGGGTGDPRRRQDGRGRIRADAEACAASAAQAGHRTRPLTAAATCRVDPRGAPPRGGRRDRSPRLPRLQWQSGLGR